jgi:CDGSH iron-sulfur domain-containing protein 3
MLDNFLRISYRKHSFFSKEEIVSEPKIAQKSPYVEEVEPKNHAWCACGLSQTQPYCDGSHKGTEFRPVVVKIEENKTVAWCGCKQTKTPPYCDGSHKNI